jgi:hypothetical protein
MENGKKDACKPRMSFKTVRLGGGGPKQDLWVGCNKGRQLYVAISGHVSTTYIVTPTSIYTVSIIMDREQGNDGLTFGVNGSQVSVLKQGHKVGLSSLLKCHHS